MSREAEIVERMKAEQEETKRVGDRISRLANLYLSDTDTTHSYPEGAEPRVAFLLTTRGKKYRVTVEVAE